ncbi:MAG TPA: AAA family ATPase, partial [Stenotrophomonas sp.]|nr:AAA family ATPase [Stenotrophomonas sp.]
MNLPPPMPDTPTPAPVEHDRLHAAFRTLRDGLSSEIVGQSAL